MAEQPAVSPFSRPPMPPRSTFTRPAPARTVPVPTKMIAPLPRVAAPKPARPVEVVESLPMGFMAGLVAPAPGAGLWGAVTVLPGLRNGVVAGGVGCPVGRGGRGAGQGNHPG